MGIERALAAALLLIVIGAGVRAVPSIGLLFGGTVLFGIGVALGNVLLPGLVKRDFPERSCPMTSLYSSAMSVGATIAAGVSVPLASALGWRGSLGMWAAPAGMALVVWLIRMRGRARPRPSLSSGASLRALGRSPLAWQIAFFMGLQSLTFYVALAWLPDLLQDRGLRAAEAGWMLALSQAAGIVGSIGIPLWAGRLADQRRIVWTLAVLEAAALGGLFLPGGAFAALWVSLLGIALGGSFGLALLLLVLRAGDAETATTLSGMVQSVGYLVAALGPTLFGFLYDQTRGWTIPLLFLVAVLIAKVIAGLGAGEPGQAVPRACPPGTASTDV